MERHSRVLSIPQSKRGGKWSSSVERIPTLTSERVDARVWRTTLGRRSRPPGAPLPRSAHAAAWTGFEMLEWGGPGPANTVLNDGARYDPALDRWTPMTGDGAPSACAHARNVGVDRHGGCDLFLELWARSRRVTRTPRNLGPRSSGYAEPNDHPSFFSAELRVRCVESSQQMFCSRGWVRR